MATQVSTAEQAIDMDAFRVGQAEEIRQSLAAVQRTAAELSAIATYSVGPLEVSEPDAVERLTTRLDQLHAQLAITHGEIGTAFRNLNDNIQENYMWSLSTLLRALIVDAHLVMDRLQQAERTLAGVQARA